MRRLLVVAVLLAAGTAPAHAQELAGSLSFTGEAGYLTNAYLDPFIPVWDRSVRAPFAAFSPAGRVSWAGERTSAGLLASGRLTTFARAASTWTLARGQAFVQHALGDELVVGLSGAGSRVRLGEGQWYAWGAPYVRWTAARTVRLGIWGGVSMRDAPFQGSPWSRSESTFAMLDAEVWPASRWHLRGSLYASRTPRIDAAGRGASVEVGYQPFSALALAVEAGVDGFGYATTADAPAWWTDADRSLKAVARVDWSVGARWALSGRLGVQDLRTGAPEGDATDVYLALGATYRVRFEPTEPPAARPLWVPREGGVRFQIRYEGEGTLYLVGDFNAWAEGDLALEPAGEESLYAATLALVPGTYHYRVLAVEGGRRRWLPFPEHALTADDGFGGENGLLVVE